MKTFNAIALTLLSSVTLTVSAGAACDYTVPNRIQAEGETKRIVVWATELKDKAGFNPHESSIHHSSLLAKAQELVTEAKGDSSSMQVVQTIDSTGSSYYRGITVSYQTPGTTRELSAAEQQALKCQKMDACEAEVWNAKNTTKVGFWGAECKQFPAGKDKALQEVAALKERNGCGANYAATAVSAEASSEGDHNH